MSEQRTSKGLPTLSVVIPCFNAGDAIGTQLEALAGQQWPAPWEVIVADNGSTDNSVEVVERYRTRLPNLRMVDASDRRGAAHARNVGVRAATGEAILFCDADDEVAPGWLAAMGRALTQHDCVACRLDIEKLNPPWVQETRPNVQRNGLTKLPFPPYCPIAGGNSLGIKRSLHEAIGGFDESQLSVEDPEYCVKVQQAGVTLHFVSEAVVHYRYRSTLAGLYRQARTWAQWNIWLFKKYRAGNNRELWRWRMHLGEWGRLLRRLPRIRSKGGFGRWLWQLGWQVGLLQGGLRYRVPPFSF